MSGRASANSGAVQRLCLFTGVCLQAAEARAYTESSTGKEAQLARELDAVRDDLDAVLADKAELETALGLLDRNSKAQIEQLQVSLPGDVVTCSPTLNTAATLSDELSRGFGWTPARLFASGL